MGPLLTSTDAVVPPAAAHPMPSLQRRYSVTGQTPPDHGAAAKSPKSQALDTSVPTANCNLCNSCRLQNEDRRTSSKRAATQGPEPSTPTSQNLPTKIAKLGLDYCGDDDDCLSDPLPEQEDWFLHEAPALPLQPAATDCGCSAETGIIGIDQGLIQCVPSSLAYLGHALPASETSFPALQAGAMNTSVGTHCDLPTRPPQNEASLPLTFCTLPPELRRQIYLHLPDLVLPYPLIYCLSTFANKKQHPLAAVNRLIRSEALAIFYGYNTWIVKLEFAMMYEAFQNWIICLGEDAALLRIVHIAVRGSLFKPRASHQPVVSFVPSNPPNPNPPQGAIDAAQDGYQPPDGDACFKVDLSEKYTGGRVELLRNDGTAEAGQEGLDYLTKLVRGLWEKKCAGTLNGQDWVSMVDQFLTFVGWQLECGVPRNPINF